MEEQKITKKEFADKLSKQIEKEAAKVKEQNELDKRIKEDKQFTRSKPPDWFKDSYFKRWYPKWVHNAMENYSTIKKDFNKENCCITAHPRPMKKPLVILAGGPSLDENIKYLKDWPHPILAPTTLLFNTVVEIDREPDYISAFDSLHKTAKDIGTYKWKDSILLTHPNAEPTTIRNWKWKKYYYRRMFKGHDFFEHYFPLMFPWIKLGIEFSGNVVNNGLSIGEFLGFDPIYVVGIDLGWWDNLKQRCTSYEMKKGNIEIINIPPATDNGPNVIKLENEFKTTPSMITFKDALLRMIQTMKSRVYLSSNGLIKELPVVDFKKIAETKGFIDEQYNKEEVKNNIKKYYEEERKEIEKLISEKMNKNKSKETPKSE